MANWAGKPRQTIAKSRHGRLAHRAHTAPKAVQGQRSLCANHRPSSVSSGGDFNPVGVHSKAEPTPPRTQIRRGHEESRSSHGLVKQTIESGAGTAIGEYLSMQGPFRLWWTTEDIPTTSPFKSEREQHVAMPEPELLPFFEWCYARFTNPESGVARLVLVPEEKRTELKQTLASTRFVSICSFRLLRRKEPL